MSTFVATAIASVRSHSYHALYSAEEYLALFRRIEREARAAEEEFRKQAQARAWELAKRQGVEPVRSIKALRGNFWPEDESTDDFLSWLRATRQEDKHRSVPE